MNALSPLLSEYLQNNTLVCPVCHSRLTVATDRIICSSGDCRHSADPIPMIQGKIPVLVNFEESILNREALIATAGESLIPRSGNKYDAIKRIFWGRGKKTKINLQKFLAAVPKYPGKKSSVLIIGGGAIGNGASEMYNAKDIDVLSFDIYASPNTDFVADGHSLPVADNSIDAVWIQAVLEHVMYPPRVVAEIHRVLKQGGVVYAETPFQQHVHEGPYDFTRFTESGHRLLFKDFRLLDSGFLTGLGTVLQWNVRYAAWGLTRSRKVAIVVAMAFAWVRLFDHLVPESFNVDTASGVYFLGRKDAGHRFSDKDIIAHYKGFQRK
ncbi:class I SAM-dependent methyltransferase [Dyadobacter fermentans]|uniref:Methyltransferase type 11 n=1 Tax=Dyadobacter fermentans (strain ATCC 700827 / DSM 18053 / CIP 107007 / KCTC 52180 / NS114) TaxID=471854 RepID=C6W506_DYAFD|nr:class I SAM-dependent methyltransferase [Dyadobacter fermentans]ACT92366.1 Methyltransferase type 11 [Dyadobacter fermentans DSM 18053]